MLNNAQGPHNYMANQGQNNAGGVYFLYLLKKNIL